MILPHTFTHINNETADGRPLERHLKEQNEVSSHPRVVKISIRVLTWSSISLPLRQSRDYPSPNFNVGSPNFVTHCGELFERTTNFDDDLWNSHTTTITTAPLHKSTDTLVNQSRCRREGKSIASFPLQMLSTVSRYWVDGLS